ncbi:hypothetical protein X975_14353, partial [Stegodyphus mimosarum]
LSGEDILSTSSKFIKYQIRKSFTFYVSGEGKTNTFKLCVSTCL